MCVLICLVHRSTYSWKFPTFCSPQLYQADPGKWEWWNKAYRVILCQVVKGLTVWALSLISLLWNDSGPMVRHYCHGISISTHPSLVLSSFLSGKRQKRRSVWQLPGGFHFVFSVFFWIKKELRTSEGCVEMDMPWQYCRTIGPLLVRDSSWQVLKHSQGGDFSKDDRHHIYQPRRFWHKSWTAYWNNESCLRAGLEISYKKLM